MCKCTGCEAFFCLNHFNEHRQELSRQFSHGVEQVLHGILNQIDHVKPFNISTDDLFSEIDQWETAMSDQVHKATAGARQQFIELISQKQNRFTDQFGILKEEIDQRRREENFIEDDIKRLQKEIEQLNRSLEELTQPGEMKLIVNEIDWDRLIYIKQTGKSIEFENCCQVVVSPQENGTRDGKSLVHLIKSNVSR
jgi:cell division protein FtsB